VNSRAELAAWLEARGVSTRPTHWSTDGLLVDEMADAKAIVEPTPRFSIQDEASHIVADVVAARPGERVLDVCAAPGGKTVALAADMRNQGLLVACDVRHRRVRRLESTLRAAGAAVARVAHIAAGGALPFSATFDAVLVDAPCSGLGTLRRDPDIKWRRTAADLAAGAATQASILDRAARCVRPGGRLVYATCSSEPEENEDVVESFLAANADFAIDRRPPAALPDYRDLFEARGWLHTWPFRDGLDAFFAAPLVRRSEDV
jgi:16S rRNA (cytosine967-C5)-methyltransferase